MFPLYPNAKLPVRVVVPTLNAADGLAACLADVMAMVERVIVADGGSVDETIAIAEAQGAAVVSMPRGRGQQLRAGAAAALLDGEAEWLLFLHADTRLQAGWVEAVAAHVARPKAKAMAAAFRFRLDDGAPAARRVERLVDWRCRWLGLPYGDQGLLIHRTLYQAVGGFRAMPLMEDVDLVRRVGRRRLCLLEADALTSAKRYRRGGYWRRPARNLALLSLYFLGVPSERLVRWYG
jgi:rSAM/selenodomain-associated transferase 2